VTGAEQMLGHVTSGWNRMIYMSASRLGGLGVIRFKTVCVSVGTCLPLGRPIGCNDWARCKAKKPVIRFEVRGRRGNCYHYASLLDPSISRLTASGHGRGTRHIKARC
jgi:hypothetical protein